MSCRITYQDVRFSYPDGTQALRGVNFALEHGEHVALLGPNGAGKSTVMLLANGVLLPNSGQIHIGERLLAPENLREIRQQVGLVFQDPDDQLFMTSVYDDVAFGPLNQGISGDELDRRVTAALDEVGLVDVSNKAPQNLSFGQRKRAALATILVMQPEFLILDEPTSNLDPRGRRQMMALLASIQTTVLIATHDLDLAWQLCQRALIIDEGVIVADGPCHELLQDNSLLQAHGLK
ncbi:MAG: energy-coupling factor ABC transporter ATP-binding protein [Coriobacteriales bacterium]|jgi:cobalt/nickel transport system ATP-binding protein|nr:energy-coupling factor ABC transporter ATP-binding protein [Coriobacteriales bacterium]